MILEAKNIRKHFSEPKRHQVLDTVSLTIHQGELVSLYGESGSGKSTLLYILSTLDTSFEGSLKIHGQETTGLSQQKLAEFRNEHVGFVYQFHHLLPEFSVLQNITLPAQKRATKKTEKINEDAFQLLEELGIAQLATYPTYKLSGGQQQRVAIARALINNPTLIIADEPTGNLDEKNSDLIFNILKEITEKRNNTVLMATHNHKFYENSHRAIEMTNGKLRL